MLFLLQNAKDSDALEIEIAELKSEIKRNNIDSYIEVLADDFALRCGGIPEEKLKNAIPVGAIEFVQAHLKEFYGIDHMNPIEVPPELRKPHLLLRNYKIVPYDEIPRNGEFFVKDVSQLKTFSYQGPTESLFGEDGYSTEMNKEHLFQVSDVLDILSEYRVIVIEDKIYGIQFYDGEPTIMPTPNEINKIKEMVARYSASKSCPKAYAMDVAIVRASNEQGRDLALIEICPAVSFGTYGCRGAFLPKMYELGYRWYLERNEPSCKT